VIQGIAEKCLIHCIADCADVIYSRR